MLKIEQNNNILIASFDKTDRFNAIIYQEVKDELNSLVIKPGANLILNLNGVNYIDSSGFGAMLSVYKTARSNDNLFRICNVKEDVMDLIKLMKLDKVFDIYDSLSDCITSF
ncbi:MAG: STAS domain-containing protein [Bacteroidota bacterium]|nr:STAS domain-containing protein [Bacteroidota bacterium]